MNEHKRSSSKILTFIFILAILLIGGCESQDTSDFIDLLCTDTQTGLYEVESNTYSYQDTYKNIMIEYPSLKANLSDSKIDLINELIKTEALKIENQYNYVYEVEDQNYLELELHYQIEYIGDSYISIAYTGLANPKWANHPTHLFYTLNIDLKQAKRIRLCDMVSVDHRFLKLFKGVINSNKAEPYPYIDAYFKDIPDDKILKYLKSSDDLYIDSHCEVYSYFTGEQICVVYPVPYAVGNHTIIKIDIKEISKVPR